MPTKARGKRTRRHESVAKGRVRMAEILDRLRDDYAGLGTALRFSNTFELLVATILSAQCTDERVNMVTPALFSRFPGPESFAEADPEEVQRLIFTTGFFRNKTKNIQGAARTLLAEFGGEVPGTLIELLRLPGVSRKTGNVVLSHGFSRAEGIAVDTHVFRVSRRLDLSRGTSPEAVEIDLMEITPPERWTEVADTFIWHGRKVCPARAPKCLDCKVLDLCPAGRKFTGISVLPDGVR